MSEQDLKALFDLEARVDKLLATLPRALIEHVAKCLALNIAHYQSAGGEIALEDTLAVVGESLDDLGRRRPVSETSDSQAIGLKLMAYRELAAVLAVAASGYGAGPEKPLH